MLWTIIISFVTAVLAAAMAYVKVKRQFQNQLNAANDLLAQQQENMAELKEAKQQMLQTNADLKYQLGECKKDLAAARR
ncbi:MAG: hypothetical protein HRU20_19250 [Pseudomonadales bacterium]|nr:hypothetical protein [Pseudomonadales bacterium]